jgi:hypothetical protein
VSPSRDTWDRLCAPAGNVSPEDEGLTPEGYLLAVLRVCPDGARLDLEECEAQPWRERLAPWAAGKTYRVDAGLVAALGELFRDDADGFRGCHHVTIRGQDGALLLTALDDFAVVWVDPALRDRV